MLLKLGGFELLGLLFLLLLLLLLFVGGGGRVGGRVGGEFDATLGVLFAETGFYLTNGLF